ncbi:MAG: hypothetical protein OXB89_02025, partial [Anaerolineaceae bacterium]|nr:hypothetical protein [Anaerolineaceae bacterium]
LGEREAQQPAEGEVIFADTTDLVIARRWCWRQSAESAARADTTEALVTCEAQHADNASAVEQALEELTNLLSRFAGGDANSAILDAGNPSL